MSLPKGISPCCLRGFRWAGTPTGKVGKLGTNDAYIAGGGDDDPNGRDAAIMIIHDLFGWEFPNVRLLADHVAREAGATVYVPDFFGGAHLPWAPMVAGEFGRLAGDIAKFMETNGRGPREPEILGCARELRRGLGYGRVGAAGFCYGGWACFRLAAAEFDGSPLVDCISVGHPSMLTTEDVDAVSGRVAVQMLAPEIDVPYSAEMKLHTFTALQRVNAPFEYRHFPGVEHACFLRGSDDRDRFPGEQEAVVKGKNAIVAWMREWLHDVVSE